MFDSHDYDRDGRLEFSELDSFLSAALSGEISEAELRHFQVMMDGDGDGAVTFKEMVAALRECWATSQAVLARDKAEGVEALARAALYLKREKVGGGGSGAPPEAIILAPLWLIRVFPAGQVPEPV